MLLESLQPEALIPLLSLGAEHKASKVHSPFAGFLCSCQARQQHTHNPSRAYYNCYYNKVLFTKVSINRTSCQTKKKKKDKKKSRHLLQALFHMFLFPFWWFSCVVSILLYFREMYLIIKQVLIQKKFLNAYQATKIKICSISLQPIFYLRHIFTFRSKKKTLTQKIKWNHKFSVNCVNLSN